MVGIADYFANIKDAIQHDFACTQLQRFHDALEMVKREIGALPPFIPASCLPVALLFGKTAFTFVRVGISMCGHRPSRELRLPWILEHQVRSLHRHPVHTLEAIAGQLQAVELDAPVRYGGCGLPGGRAIWRLFLSVTRAGIHERSATGLERSSAAAPRWSSAEFA